MLVLNYKHYQSVMIFVLKFTVENDIIAKFAVKLHSMLIK